MIHFNLQTCKEILYNVSDYTVAKTFTALLFCTYAYIFKTGDVLIPVFLLVIIDSITGIMFACRQKELSSKGFSRVAMKFFVYLLLMATAGILDQEFPGQYATTSMKSFLMMTEAISIMENIGKLGWPVPLKILQFLKMQSDAQRKKENKK